ncbi:hypothetical protein [Curtobacterium sp. MCBD17_021]|uniref:CBU_0592 family membrane protein n=1 Tax=Curtobacterium sp. MCBD17_021 TaxID=2175665 RepID=UPI000DA9CAA8|nr:hypothetical protein [Curtobacterium sp. MCBD17_021]PZE69711.1 hypothetical protein DEI83_01285 [Curtobacterium sp. MCBD17_021]
MLVGVVEFLGWFGAVTVLVGYILFSLGKIANGPVYQLFNLVGGVAIAVNVAAHHAVPSTIVNSIWAAVAAVVLVRMVVRRRRGAAGVQPTPELHAEPPTTTAVLPVIGPALRDHDLVETGREPAPQQAPTSHVADATTDVAPTPGLPSADGDRTGPAVGHDAPAPMTETVPVITATIALALVQAAHQQHAQQQGAAQRDTAQPEPADAP